MLDQTRKGGENIDVFGSVSNKRTAAAFQVDVGGDIEVKYYIISILSIWEGEIWRHVWFSLPEKLECIEK